MPSAIITDNLYNLNIERAVLCTAIFEPTKFEEIAVQLKADDFYHPFHQNLFTAMEELDKNDQPIDEEFLKEKLIKKNQFNEAAFLDVIAYTNPLANVNVYVKEIKQKAKNREMLELVSKTKHKIEAGEANAIEAATKILTDVEQVFISPELEIVESKVKYKQSVMSKIQKLRKLLESEFVEQNEHNILETAIKKLENKIGLNQKREWDDSFDAWLDQFDMDPDEVDKIEVEYAIDGIVVKGSITTFFAAPETGKSRTAIAISNESVLNGSIEKVMYLDLDNLAHSDTKEYFLL